MKRFRVVFSLIGAGVLVFQGCTATPSRNGVGGDAGTETDGGNTDGGTKRDGGTKTDAGVVVDSGDGAVDGGADAGPVDSGTDAGRDSGTDAGAVDSGTDAGAVDSGTDAGSNIPVCYNTADGDAQIFAASTDPASAFGYHPAMPHATGCSTADISAYEAAINSGNFLSVQYSTNNAAGVSASCKSCIMAEYANASTSSNPWGVSGLRTDAQVTQFALPSSSSFFNFYGCTEVRGVLNASEAAAAYGLDTCLGFACPTSDDGTACGTTGSTRHNACVSYALSSGACAPLAASGQAAFTKAQNALVAGICGDAAGVINAFCGN